MHELLINHPPFVVHTYGAMLALAFILSILLTTREAQKVGIPADAVLDMSIMIIVLSVIMSRAGYVLTAWNHEFASHPADALKIWTGGLSFHGGVVGGAIAGIIFCRMRKIRFFHIGDAVMPGLALGLAIGRIGCFLNGCCFGGPTHLPWAVKYPFREGALPPFDAVPRHPTQLYDFAMNIAIMLLLISPLKKFKRKDGDLFAFWLILSGISRFIMEIFRSGQSSVVAGSTHLTIAQWLCIAMIAAGVIFYLVKGQPPATALATAAAPQPDNTQNKKTQPANAANKSKNKPPAKPAGKKKPSPGKKKR